MRFSWSRGRDISRMFSSWWEWSPPQAFSSCQSLKMSPFFQEAAPVLKKILFWLVENKSLQCTCIWKSCTPLDASLMPTFWFSSFIFGTVETTSRFHICWSNGKVVKLIGQPRVMSKVILSLTYRSLCLNSVVQDFFSKTSFTSIFESPSIWNWGRHNMEP